VVGQGVVQERKNAGEQVRFLFRFLKSPGDLKLGESIAVNGVCLTVSAKASKGFWVDVVAETLKATTLGSLTPGCRVNLERSLRFGDRMGGHFVTGHVDGTGRILKITREGRNVSFDLEVSAGIRKFIVPKGSIAMDGISLTVQAARGKHFSIALIPHTLQVTNLGSKRAGDNVNVEVDLLARYQEDKSRRIKRGKTRGITLSGLLAQGF